MTRTSSARIQAIRLWPVENGCPEAPHTLESSVTWRRGRMESYVKITDIETKYDESL